jgi:hypothetical protein
MLKRFFWIGIVLLCIVVIAWFVFFFFSGSRLPDSNSDHSPITTATHSFIVGFEGDFQNITYRFPVDSSAISVTPLPNGSTLFVRDRVSDTVSTISFVYNGAAGFSSSQEMWSAHSYCPDCVAQSVAPVSFSGSDVVVFKNQTDYWIVFARDPGFVVARVPVGASAVFDFLSHFELTVEHVSSEMPRSIGVSLFFFNESKRSVTDCNEVVPVNRFVVATPQIARAALLLLLAGPTPSEIGEGYFSEIPAHGWIHDVRIVDGVALVDLTERVDAGGGSCRKQAIVTQIERTLLQFSTVKKVVLSVNGVSTGIFQP